MNAWNAIKLPMKWELERVNILPCLVNGAEWRMTGKKTHKDCLLIGLTVPRPRKCERQGAKVSHSYRSLGLVKREMSSLQQINHSI